ncbi:hypothetical protein FGB62_80g00 [Gracilaria domingensis]|nr:hypothetical protein FGB62_80g00 [Gracilaria domingensis]
MLSRLLKVQSVLAYTPFTLLNELQQRGIDAAFELQNSLTVLLSSQSFWTRVREAHALFHPVSLFVALLESETNTMADTYACLIATKIAKRGANVISDVEKNQIEMSLIRRWDRIYSPVHALAFQCDAYYFEFRDYVTIHFGAALLELNKGSLTDQCHNGIEDLAQDEEHWQLLFADYLEFCINPGSLLAKLKNIQPRYVSGQMKEKFAHLSPALDQVYIAPASTSAVERHHEVSKRILTQLRCRLHDLNLERQVAVAHNSADLRRTPLHKRQSGFDKFLEIVRDVGHHQGSTVLSDLNSQGQVDVEWGDDLVLLKMSLAEIETPSSIPNPLVFGIELMPDS